MAFPVNGVLDNFNRANEGPPLSTSWTSKIITTNNTLQVVSNQAWGAGFNSSAWWNVTTFGPDSEAYVTSADGFGQCWLWTNLQTPGTTGLDGYRFSFFLSSGNLQVFRVDDNVATQLGGDISGSARGAGDAFGGENIGGTLTGYVKPSGGSWTAYGATRTDTTYGTGYIGFTVTANNGTADDFGGGTVGGVTPPTTTGPFIGLYNYFRSGHSDTSYQIGVATSTDGITWTRGTEPTIPVGTGWELGNTVQPSVVTNGAGQLWCFYTGDDGGSNSAIGMATSQDGITWTKYASNPVISPTLGFEGTQCYIPCVLYDTAETDAAKRFKLWYAAAGGAAIGYASSPDGITWTKKATAVLAPTGSGWEQSLVSPQGIVLLGGTYYLYYAGYGASGSNYPVSVGLVTFTDPLGTYTRSANNPLLAGDGITTTLTAQCSSSATQITVTSSTAFPVGCPIWVWDSASGGNRFLTTVASKPDSTHINMADAAPVTVPNGQNVSSAAWHSVCSSGTPYYDGSTWRSAGVGFKGGGDIANRLSEQAIEIKGAALDGAWSIEYADGLLLTVPVSETTGTHTSTENLSFSPFVRSDPSLISHTQGRRW